MTRRKRKHHRSISQIEMSTKNYMTIASPSRISRAVHLMRKNNAAAARRSKDGTKSPRKTRLKKMMVPKMKKRVPRATSEVPLNKGRQKKRTTVMTAMIVPKMAMTIEYNACGSVQKLSQLGSFNLLKHSYLIR